LIYDFFLGFFQTGKIPRKNKKVVMRDIRIAVVVAQFRLGDTPGNLKQISTWSKMAAEQGASIVCFPELNLTGYFSGSGIRKYAEKIPGMSSVFVQNLARKNNITILAGIAEIDDKEEVYAVHLVVKPDGTVRTYRKLHLGPPEKEVFTPGDHIPLFEMDGFKFGVQLCYDAHFPELSTRMAVEGADVIFIPHASPGADPGLKLASWMRHLPARAFDNGLFIIACNPCGENGKGLTFPGVAVVLDPLGNVLQSYTGDEEHMIIADLKKETLNSVRQHKMRYFLPNRRPDLYSSK
jgi:predicted amidohydrolase